MSTATAGLFAICSVMPLSSFCDFGVHIKGFVMAYGAQYYTIFFWSITIPHHHDGVCKESKGCVKGQTYSRRYTNYWYLSSILSSILQYRVVIVRSFCTEFPPCSSLILPLPILHSKNYLQLPEIPPSPQIEESGLIRQNDAT